MDTPYRPPRASTPGDSPSRNSQPRGSPPKKSSPRRDALHERSESRNNERSARMLRMVGTPEASTYGTPPYPTKPSQILAPKPSPAGAGPPSPYEIVARAQSRLSQHTRDTWVPSNATRARRSEAANTPSTVKHSDEYFGENPQATSTFYATSADDSSSAMTPDQEARAVDSETESNPDLKANTSFLEPRTSDESSNKGRPSGESVVQLPSVPVHQEVIGYAMSSSMTEPFSEEYPAVPPRAEEHRNPVPSPLRGAILGRQPLNKESDASLASANSSGTVIVKKPRDGKKRASYSAFPSTHQSRPSSSKSSLPLSTPTKPQRNDSDDSAAPASPVSPSSPTSETYATSRPISSVPAYTSLQEANSKSVDVQYPVIQPPSVSGSWAEISTPPPRPPKAAERGQERWNPHLSTVISLGSSSPTADRSSQGTWPLESSRGSKTSSNLTKWSPRISTDFPPVPRQSSDFSPSKDVSDSPPVPPLNPARLASPPLNPSRLASPPPVRQRDFTGSTIRKVDENEVANFSPTSPGQGASQTRKSPALQTLSPDPQGERRGSAKRASTASFFKDIPAWAKSYYARPNSAIFMPRSDSHTSADILGMGNGRKGSRDVLNGKELTLAEVNGPPMRRITPNWSPHLWHDRTSLGRRRSVFKAPSMDERAEGKALTKRNAQIILFAVGFIFPLCKDLTLPQPPFTDDVFRLVRCLCSSTPI